MKRILPIALVAVLGIGAVAYAVPDTLELVGKIFRGGITIGNTGTKISDSYAASSSVDFAGVTDQCEDSTGIAVTGAAVNDTCDVGPPSTMPCAHCWVTCYVSAADTVKVRLCAHGASGNPAASTYSVRVFDP